MVGFEQIRVYNPIGTPQEIMGLFFPGGYLQLWADVFEFWMHSRYPVVDSTSGGFRHRNQRLYGVFRDAVPDSFELERQIVVTDVCGEPHCVEERLNLTRWQRENPAQRHTVCHKTVSSRRDPTAFPPVVDLPTPASQPTLFVNPLLTLEPTNQVQTQRGKHSQLSQRERAFLFRTPIQLSCEVQRLPKEPLCLLPPAFWHTHFGALHRHHQQHFLLFSLHAQFTQVFFVLNIPGTLPLCSSGPPSSCETPPLQCARASSLTVFLV